MQGALAIKDTQCKNTQRILTYQPTTHSEFRRMNLDTLINQGTQNGRIGLRALISKDPQQADFADLSFSRSAVRTVETRSVSESEQEEEGGEEEEKVGWRDP